MLWLALSILAALMWGVQYATTDQLLEKMTPAGLLLITNTLGVIVFGVLFYFEKSTSQFNWENLAKLWPMLLIMLVAACVAEWAIATSISEKNATLSSMVEISYPFFTALVAYFFYRQQDLTWVTATGGTFILFGVGVVLWGSRMPS